MRSTQSHLDTLFSQAKSSPRLRQSYDLRNGEKDNIQRMLNALEPGTAMPIHRHMSTSESIAMLQGKIVDENGIIAEEFIMELGGERPMVQVEVGQWHTQEVLEEGTAACNALDKACFFIAGIDERSLLQAVDTAVSMNAAGDHGIPVPDYVEENVSTKVVKIIQSYVGIVDRMVWRKN